MSGFAEIIAIKKGLLGSGQINRNTAPSLVAEILGTIKQNCDLLTKVKTTLDTQKDGNLDCFVNSSQEDIFRSFLSSDLLQLYDGVYFKNGLGYDVMGSNLKSIIKLPTDDQKAKKARANFGSLVRRTDIDETFTSFLKRLKAEVAIFCKQEEYAQVLVEEHFRNSLREMDRDFLLMLSATHNNTGVDKLKHEAKILDEKGLHKKVSREVKALTAISQAESSVAALTESVIDFLKEETQARKLRETREEQMRKEWADFQRTTQAQIAQALRMNIVPPAPTQAPGQYTPPTHNSQINNILKQNPGQKRLGFSNRIPQKEPCWECGNRFHLTKDCPKNCKAKCFLCGKIGHLSSARKFHGVDQKNE